MALRTATRSDTPAGVVFQWTGLLNGDTGSLVNINEYGDRSVQVTGTFGLGGSVNVEGNLDGANNSILRAPDSSALTFTAAGLKQILETSLNIRPNVTAGDGTTSLVVTLYARRSLK